MKPILFLLLSLLPASFALSQTSKSDTAKVTIVKKVVDESSDFPISATRKLTLTGYTQPRFQYFQDTSKISTFDIRRARLALNGGFTDKINYRLFVELAGNVPPQLLEAIFSYTFDPRIKLSIGQMLVPLGNDIIASETKMETVNRAVLSEQLGARGLDVIGNQNARDIGVQASGLFKLNNRPVINYAAGLFNGSGINKQDNDKDKTFAARVIVSPVKGLWLGGSYYNGSGRWGTDLTIDKNRDRAGAELEYKYKRITFRSEYMMGKDDTIGRNGYYIQLIGEVIPKKLQLSGRYEFFDFNNDADDDAMMMYTICPGYYFSEHARIQIGYDIVREEAKTQKKNDVLEAQFQLAF